MEERKLEILLVGDNPAEAGPIKEMLAQAEFTVEHAVCLADALGRLRSRRFDAVLVDPGTPEGQGLESALAVRELSKQTPVVVLAALDDEDTALKALRMDIQDYLIKGELNGGLLARSLRHAIQRKRAADALAARVAELETANRELEAFNCRAAHDLRKSLAAINGCCLALRELCGDKLDEESSEYLREAYDGTLRMSRLIEALLVFSRLTHVRMCREPVDLSSMARGVAEQLKGMHAERRVTFRITDGAHAVGDPNLLRTVLANLLGNAWKHTSRREEAFIEFGETEIDGRPAWFVRDNGIGFAMAEAGSLFLPFRHLAGTEEFRGHGIGLAAVERIIRRHGGRVWAEGEPDKGATFWFTLQ